MTDSWNWEQPRGPQAHKAAARQLGVPRNSAKELIVLVPANDPFYQGTPSDIRDADWFASLIERFGLQLGAHIRRVHYRAITNPITLPDGRPYENTLTCWNWLGAASKSARILGRVDVESMIDRRNAGAIENASARDLALEPPDWLPTGGGLYLPTLDFADIDDVTGHLASPFARGYDYNPGDQPVMIEIWCEKSTMADILLPLCQQEGLNLVQGTGFESITQSVAFLRRAERYGKAAHIIYVSDFDPAGVSMPVAVARQVQFWLDELGIDVDVSLEPLVLTHEQCIAYELPRTPIKDEDKRGPGFEAKYGEGATELDALEALRPGELARIIRQDVARYRDRGLQRRLAQARQEAQPLLDEAWEAAGGRELESQMDELVQQADAVASERAEQIRAIMEETRERLQPFADRAEELTDQARRIKEGLDVELPERPEPEIAGPDARILFDSRRGWLNQLLAFKTWQRGESQ